MARFATAIAASLTASDIVGMGVAGAGEVLGRAAELHQNRDLVDHLAGAKAHDMPAEHAVAGGVGEDLDEAVGVAHRPRPPVGGERKLADLVGDALGFQLFLALADRGDLRAGVDDVGNDAVVHVASLPRQHLGERDAFVLRLVGQHRPADDVADRIDPRNVGGVMRVDHDLAALGLDADRLEAEALGERAPANRDQHDVGLDRLRARRPLAGSIVALTPPPAFSTFVTLWPR